MVEEKAELLLWFASPANSMIVGQMLLIDGGAEATVCDNYICGHSVGK